MAETMKETPHRWWFDCYKSSKRSQWLQTTLAELDVKTKGMLKLIEEDADSFAQRAEMYYKKRPELISMVEDFYRAHRSLAEKYDQAKSDGARVLATLESPFSSYRYRSEKRTSKTGSNYDTYSDTFGSEEYPESEVDDPEEESNKVHVVLKEPVSDVDDGSQIEDYIKEDIEWLKEENETLKKELVQKGEVTKEAVTLLGIANNEAMKLRTEIAKLKEENDTVKKEKFEVISLLNRADAEVMKLNETIKILKEEKEQLEEATIQIKQELSQAESKVMKLKEKIVVVKRENELQKEQLITKDKMTMDVINQLNLVVDTYVESESSSSWRKGMNYYIDNEGYREVSRATHDTELVTKLTEETERLEFENRKQKELIMQKDELIRQLNLAVETCVHKVSSESSSELPGTQSETELSRDAMKVIEGIERLKQETKDQEEQLMQKDEEKREVIRQLCLGVEVLKDDNLKLRKYIATTNSPQKWSPFQFDKLKDGFVGKLLFNGCSKSKSSHSGM